MDIYENGFSLNNIYICKDQSRFMKAYCNNNDDYEDLLILEAPYIIDKKTLTIDFGIVEADVYKIDFEREKDGTRVLMIGDKIGRFDICRFLSSNENIPDYYIIYA